MNFEKFIQVVSTAILGDKIYHPIKGTVLRTSIENISGFDTQDEGYWVEVECFSDKFNRRIFAEVIQGYNSYDKPCIGDTVVIQFIDGDVSKPIVMGVSHSSAKTTGTLPFLVQGVSHTDETAHADKRIVNTKLGLLHYIDEKLQRITYNAYDKLRVVWDGLKQTINVITQGNNTLVVEDNITEPKFTLTFTDGTVLAVEGMIHNGKLINKNFTIVHPHGTKFESLHDSATPIVRLTTASGVTMAVNDVNNNDKYENKDIILTHPNGNKITLLNDGKMVLNRGENTEIKLYTNGKMAAKLNKIDLKTIIDFFLEALVAKFQSEGTAVNKHLHPMGATIQPDPVYADYLERNWSLQGGKLKSLKSFLDAMFQSSSE